MSKTQRIIEFAGFRVHKAYLGARWFEVTSPDGDRGYVLCQSYAAWHFFYRDILGTASNSSVHRCHRGGLGDAIGTDSQMKTYKRLLSIDNVPPEIRSVDSVYAAMSQVQAD